MSVRTLYKSSLLRSATTYGLFNIFRQLIPFFLLPIITHYLTPADYGVLSMFTILISFAYVFVGLNLDGSIGREYFEKNQLDFPNFVTNCLYIVGFSTILFIPIAYYSSFHTEKFTGVPGQLLWYILIIVFFRFFTQVILVIWQSAKKPFSYCILQLGQTLAEILLAIVLIVLFNMQMMGRIHSILWVTIIFSFISLFFLYREGWLKSGWNIHYIKKSLAFGIPLIPHVIGGIAISMSDRILLMNMLGEEATGLYFIGFQIGNAVNLFVAAFHQAWAPWLFENLKKEEEKINRNIVKFSYIYIVAIACLVFMVCLIAPVIFNYFLGSNFKGGLPVVFWIASGSGFLGMYYLVSTYITYTRKTHILSWITLFVGVINIIISYFLIKINGYIGAAQGTAISYFLSFIFTWYLAAKSYRMPWLLR